MIDPVSPSGHMMHAHDHGKADEQAFSLVRASAFQRVSGAILILIPLWIAVYWIVMT